MNHNPKFSISKTFLKQTLALSLGVAVSTFALHCQVTVVKRFRWLQIVRLLMKKRVLRRTQAMSSLNRVR
jgi:AraC-like DNA-binding protein